MSIDKALSERCGGMCELCQAEPASNGYVVSPKNDDSIDHQVALCNTCLSKLDDTNAGFHWRCLEGSIWSPIPAVQALSYRILQGYITEDWASGLIGSTDYDEDVVAWAMSALEKPVQHVDAFGNVLENGDNVVLTQALDVKGAGFTANKGTVVKKIRLVADNAEQIEARVENQSIVILTKYVKKG